MKLARSLIGNEACPQFFSYTHLGQFPLFVGAPGTVTGNGYWALSALGTGAINLHLYEQWAQDPTATSCIGWTLR
jgi:hypothetical protein